MQPTDFEALPIGTGAELARLSDTVRELAEALENLLCYTGGSDTNDPTHPIRVGIDTLKRLGH